MTIKAQNPLSCITINPSLPAQKSIIWLHGLGASGDDFVPIVPELKLPPALGIRFIFPHAPVMPVTINQGYEMPAWFDIAGISLHAKEDKEGIYRSVNAVEQLIANEIANGIASTNIILAGFSQGAAIALCTGIRYHQPLAGILDLSGYLPLADDTLQQASVANRNLPIFIAHGTSDTIVPIQLAEFTRKKLEEAGYPINWHHYPMPHTVCAAEVNDISQWIQARYRLSPE